MTRLANHRWISGAVVDTATNGRPTETTSTLINQGIGFAVGGAVHAGSRRMGKTNGTNSSSVA